ncbi:hypothetical protein R3P38DRAFT_554367 [Favolaschia claudopus]|uniref:Uncharacterized protein n=1 Tax=Favolaschia claudopus TaxID=2862362 RepID=A0AAV9ZB54_9AGAR
MIMHPSLVITLYALLQVPRCLSTLSNRTIDDFNGDTVTGQLPIYVPPNSWNAVVNSNCSFCSVKPVASETFDHTWHDITARDNTIVYSVTLQFTGTAVYFFGIVPNTVPGTKTVRVINTAFSLDGTSAAPYSHKPDTSSEILYSVPMLSLEGLANIPHTLVAQAQAQSLLLFDYAVYTFDDGPGEISTSSAKTSSQSMSALSTTNSDMGGTVSIMTVTTSPASASQIASSKSNFPVATVVGSVCGVVAVLLLVCALLWFRRRRYRAVPHVEAFNAATVGATPSQFDDTPGVSPYTSMGLGMREISTSESFHPSAAKAPGPSSSRSGSIPPRPSLPSTSVRSLSLRTALPPYSRTDPADNPAGSSASRLGERSQL